MEKLNGYSPEEGFDSPSFAAWLLNKMNSCGLNLLRGTGYRRCSRKTDNPRIGDLVFYDSGYAMFYFREQIRDILSA